MSTVTPLRPERLAVGGAVTEPRPPAIDLRRYRRRAPPMLALLLLLLLSLGAWALLWGLFSAGKAVLGL